MNAQPAREGKGAQGVGTGGKARRERVEEVSRGVMGGRREWRARRGRSLTVTLVKAFKKGEVLSLTSAAPAGTAVASADVCLVKILVGPGNPGPAGAPSTSSGIGIEVWLPAHANWSERYTAFGGGGPAGGPDITSLTAMLKYVSGRQHGQLHLRVKTLSRPRSGRYAASLSTA